MEEVSVTSRKIDFRGNGGEYFAILITNFFLTLFTLGLYYPWAKVNKLKYLFEHSALENSRFTFHGTGKEIFMGFIKIYAAIVVFYGAVFYAAFNEDRGLLQLIIFAFYVGIIAIIPFAIHSALRYRTSRTSWRGIHFGYRGDRMELVILFVKGVFLTFITLGIYSFWFTTDLRKYIIGKLRFGSITFRFTGDGVDYFLLTLKGYFFSIFTLGLYLPWFAASYSNFLIKNTFAEQDGNDIQFTSSITGLAYFQLFFVNILLIVFTLGIATPWVIIRTYKFMFERVSFDGNFDSAALLQTEEEYKDAAGEDVADILDIGII